MSANARSNARQAGHHPLVEKGARLGYAANGVINILIGWIALQLALGGGMGGGGAGGSEASASGALRTLAGSTWGSVLLYVVLVGFALLGLWQATSAFLAHETKDRVKAAAKAVVYLGLAGLTYTVINGAGGSGGGTTGATATLMQQPFGRLLVGLVGLGVIAVGLYHVYKGWKKKFLEDLRQNPGHGAVVAGRAGYIARGIALAVVGGLLVLAAVRSNPQQAQGLDAALQTLQQAPFGKVLLALVALGFVAYGIYSFFRAKYARV